MIRTHDGYLWLGTVNGLVRFDGIGRRTSSGVGAQFPVFDERNTPGLGSSLIVKLFEDSRGHLWIGTETAGVARVKDGILEHIDLGRGTRDGRLVSITEDADGAVWMYTADGQLARYANGKLQSWETGGNYPSTWYRAVVADNSGLLWLGTDRSLVTLDPASPENTGAPAVTQEAPVVNLDFILASSTGGCWRLANGRIQKWNGHKLERDLGGYPWNTWNTRVYAACEDLSGNLVVGTGGEGVFWFDAQGGFVRLNTANGLSYNTILSLCADREGNLWVGTDGGGLNRVRQQVFQVMEPSRDLVVKSVSEDSDGGLWVGYNRPRIDYWKDGRVTSYTNTHGLLDLYVRSLLVDRNRQIWAGTLNRGLLRFSDGLFLSTRDTAFLRRDREVCALFEDHSGRLWLGTSGMLAWNNGNSWKTYGSDEGLPGNYVRAISEDPDGNIWVGSEGGGLAVISKAAIVRGTNSPGGRLIARPPGLASQTFPAASVTCMYWDRDGVLWAGTSIGLARFGTGKWTWYTNHSGLSNGNIGYMIEDDAGFLWMGSNTGLMRVPRAALNAFASGQTNNAIIPVRFYGKPDGMPTRECSMGSQPAACRAADGTLWFPTIKGLVSVNPRYITRNTNPPPVIIEAVYIDGRLATSDRLRAVHPRTVEVPAGKEAIDIHYTSLNLSAPEQSQFRYQLKGYESGWTVTPANTRSVHYSRLPHGDYVFHVAACNEDGVWNEAGSSLAITVLPPFWKTWWFIAIVSLVSLGLVIGTVHFISTQRLQRQLAALRQHEALEHERSRIARDLHDQLGANLTQVALLGELAEADKDLPAEVEGHARQISQTARETTRSLDEIVWTVNPSNDTLEGLGNYICKYAQDYLGTAEIKYRLDVPPQLPATPISPELRHNVFLVAKEALHNLVKHSGATTARLRLAVEPHQFVIEIADNGRGLPPDAAVKGRNGLRNMTRRMEEVHGAFSIGPAPDSGTVVRLTAPLPR